MTDLSYLTVDGQKRPNDLGDDVRLRWVPDTHERYAVTDDGRVFSYTKNWSTPSGAKELSPKVQTSRSGHLQIILTVDGDCKHKGVHQLVLRAFVGPRPTPKHETRHLNGEPTDNRPENLKWGTSKENKADMRKHGTQAYGESSHSAKLTTLQVKQIRKLYASGDIYQEELANRFDVCQSTISKILRRETFRPSQCDLDCNESKSDDQPQGD